jgi:hypothetical protein
MSTPANDFFDSIDYPSIIDNIKGIFTSDASISTLLDFERVLDEADMYAFKHWDLGELVSGPEIKKYTVTCVFMYPYKLMPDPRGGKRLISVGCNIKFKKTKIKVPVQIETPGDYMPGSHFPKAVEREVWLVRIEIPKQLMNDIREGTVDLAGQTIDLEELDHAYEKDYDKEAEQAPEQGQMQQPGMAPPGMAPPGPGMAPPAPPGMM